MPLRVRRYFFSWWPPNCMRIADNSLFWKSASPREAKREYSAEKVDSQSCQLESLEPGALALVAEELRRH